MSWLALSFLSAGLFSLVNISDKYVLSGIKVKSVIPLIVLSIIGVVVGGFIAVFHGLGSLSLFHILLAFIGGIFFILMTILYFEAAKSEEISRVVPLFYLSPIFILLLAHTYLRESLTINQYIAAGLLIAGAILLSSQKIQTIKLNKAFWLMVFAALSVSINQVITKYLLQFTDYWTIFAYMRFGVLLVLMPYVLAHFTDIKKLYRKRKSQPFILMGVSELTNLGGVLSGNAAASLGSVTLVNAVASIQPLIILLIAIPISIFYPKILKEEISKGSLTTKFIAITLMMFGAILIS